MSGFRKLALVFAVLFAAFVAGRATAQDAPDIAGSGLVGAKGALSVRHGCGSLRVSNLVRIRT